MRASQTRCTQDRSRACSGAWSRSGAAVAAYALVARPWYLRWGATDEEVTRALPGDDLAKGSTVGSTRAVTIWAPVETVWPWLIQIGYGRRGFYSYDGLENLFVRLLRATPGYRSVETILPEHQRLSPGDFIGGRPLEPDRRRCLQGVLPQQDGSRGLGGEARTLRRLARGRLERAAGGCVRPTRHLPGRGSSTITHPVIGTSQGVGR